MLGIGRREFITLLGGAAAAWPLAARAQQSRKVPRIGVLLPGTAASFALRTKAFLEGLRNLGYVEGQTIEIEWKWGQDRAEGLPELAAELVGRNIDSLSQVERRQPRHSRARPERYRLSWQSSAIRSLLVLWRVLRGQAGMPPGSALLRQI